MADDILRMRGHHQDLPRRQGAAGRQPVRAPRRDPRDLRGERRGQVDADEGAVRGLPARLLRGRDHLRRASRARSRASATASSAGIVIIHQELALCPQLSIAENIFLGNEQATRGLIDWNRTNHEAEKLLARVGLRENPVTPVLDIGVGKQQLVEIAKALSKEVQAAHPRRADRRAQRRRLRAPARPAARPARRGHHLRDHLATSSTRSPRSPTRITILRDGRTIETLDMRADEVHRGPDHLRHGRPRPGAPLPAARVARRRGGAADRGLDRAQPDPARPGRRRRAPTSRCARGEIVGLAGLMGAGRTELAMSVFGRSYGVDISGRPDQGRRADRGAHGGRRDPASASPTPPRTASATGST